MPPRVRLLGLAALAACGGSAHTGDTWGPDAYAPLIVSIDRAACAEDATLGEVWDLALTVDDPQGADTVTAGAVSAQNGSGGEIGRYELSCADGACAGSFRADYDGVTCAHEGVLVFQVADEGGNASPTRTHP